MTGDCILQNNYDIASGDVASLSVIRADPKIRISRPLLLELGAGEARSHVALVGDVLTINAENKKVVYRVDFEDYDPVGDSYSAEWPD